jgi:hypothetical protein
MGRVRVFYGHEGVVPPTGLRARSAAAPAAPEVDEVVSNSTEGEPIELVGELVEDGAAVAPGGIVHVDGTPVPVDADGIPVLEAAEEEPAEADALPDDSWTKGDLLAFAEKRGFDMTGATKTKPLALARVLESLKEK